MTTPLPPFPFPELRTERLDLRLLCEQDTDALFAHFSDPRVTEFMDIEPLTAREEAADIIAFHREHRGCRYGVFTRNDPRLVGTCGFHAWREEPEPVAEIGFDLAFDVWGRGFMGEILAVVVPFAFAEMGLQAIEAEVDPANARCLRLLHGLGFERHADSNTGLIMLARRAP